MEIANRRVTGLYDLDYLAGVRFLLFVCCLCIVLPKLVKAQPAIPPSRDISIHVTDEQQHALDFVSISLRSIKDSVQLFSLRSDSVGHALLNNVPPGNYLLCVSHVNYQPACQAVDIGQQQTGNGYLYTFALQRIGDLQQVTITGKKPAIQYAPDRTIINVDASIGNAGTTALEVLERSPGVTIDKDGNISLKGRNQVLVMIDSKPSYLSGTELATMLAGMSSNQIETIDLIDKPSARYDAAGNGGIINIHLKKNRQRGFNGNLSLAAGQGVYSKTNNSLALNYRNGKINLFSNYSLNSNGNYLDMYALRTYLLEDDKTIQSILEQPTYFNSRFNNHALRAGVDYALSSRTDIGLVLSGTLMNRHGTGSGQARWMNAAGSTDSLIDTHSTNKTDWKNGAVNVNLRHKFSAKQQLAADLDWVGYRIQGNQAFQNERKGNDAYIESYTGALPSTIRILSFKADHSITLQESLLLETGIKVSNTNTDNDAAYFVNQGAGWEEDLAKTNHFLYAENIRAAYASIEKKSQQWSMQMGLRYEYTSYTGEQLGNSLLKDSAFSNRYGSLFPNFLATYKIDSLNELSLSFGKRIDRPPYQKLNPFVSILNKYTYQAGNPLMKPQYTHNLELTHRFKDFLSTGLSYSITTDYFSQIFYTDSIGTVYYTEGNLGKRQVLGLSVGFNKAVLRAWSVNAQVDLQHKKMKGFVWKEMAAQNTQMSLSLSNQVRFNKVWVAELSGYYITRSQSDIQEVVEPTGQVSLGISRQVLKNKGSLKLSFRDIFYTQDMEGFTLFNHATEYFRLQRDTRVATLAFTYRFGKGIKAQARKVNSPDEMERVNN